MNTSNGYDEIKAQFGDPSNSNGSLNQAWLHASIVTISPPFGGQLYYQESQTALIPIKGISIHNLLKDSFQNVLFQIWTEAIKQIGRQPADDSVRTWLHDRRLDVTAGGFNFRPSSGDSSKLSLHAYGIAIDWDPLHNPHQKPLVKSLEDWWYQIWKSNGWTDGRHFGTPDPMHVQFASGA